MTGIEPAFSAWEADVLPLNYIRIAAQDTQRPSARCTEPLGRRPRSLLALPQNREPIKAPSPCLTPCAHDHPHPRARLLPTPGAGRPLDARRQSDNTCCRWRCPDAPAVPARHNRESAMPEEPTAKAARTATTELPEPELFARGSLKLAARLFGPGNLRADQAQVDRLRSFAQEADPLADRLAAVLQRDPRARDLFEHALKHGVDSLDSAPEELFEFFHEVERTPYWVDHDRIDRGARSIVRTGVIGLIPLGDMSLMGGYLASRAVKTLVGTGDLEYEAARRLAETAAWWIDVTTPGALKHGGDGYAAALRVRLLHAHVRAAMNRRHDWNYDEWDHPVNQVQTAGTLLLFSQVFLLGTRMLGVRYTQ